MGGTTGVWRQWVGGLCRASGPSVVRDMIELMDLPPGNALACEVRVRYGFANYVTESVCSGLGQVR